MGKSFRAVTKRALLPPVISTAGGKSSWRRALDEDLKVPAGDKSAQNQPMAWGPGAEHFKTGWPLSRNWLEFPQGLYGQSLIVVGGGDCGKPHRLYRVCWEVPPPPPFGKLTCHS